MRPIPVREIMSMNIASASPGDTAEKAAKLMASREVGSVLIMKGEVPLGIITERDLVRKVISEGKDPRLVKLEDIMSEPLITASVDMEINEAAEFMERNNVHKLPLVNDGKIVGIITDHDVLKVEPHIVEALQEKDRARGGDILIPSNSRVRGICELCENYSSKLDEINGCWICPTCKGDMVS